MNLIVRELSDLADKKAKYEVSQGLGNYDNLYRDNLCLLVVKEATKILNSNADEVNKVNQYFGIRE